MQYITDTRSYRIEPAYPLFEVSHDPIGRILRKNCPWMTFGPLFAEQFFGAGPWPPQGWKLHVSATAKNAHEVIKRTLPILLDSGARFKVIKSLSKLLAFNAGGFGNTQIGKFITIYPSDDGQAVELARQLDKATEGLAAPHIPTDRTVRAGSLVSYRYGGFWPSVSANDGSDDATIFDEAQRLIVDHRLPYYFGCPLDLPDPFLEVFGEQNDSDVRSAFAGRFVILEALSRGTWGRTYKAIDLDADPPSLCILKEFWHDVAMDYFGRDAKDHALLEASILQWSDSRLGFPGYHVSFESEGNIYLVLEYLPGITLEEHAINRWRAGLDFSAEEIATLGLKLAEIIRRCHLEGLILRDVKPSNIMCAEDGSLRPIDVATSYRLGIDVGPPLGSGTVGYMHPEQQRMVAPAYEHDVYSWAMTLRFVATGREPTHTPSSHKRLQPLQLLRPDLPEDLAELADRAIGITSDDRIASMDVIVSRLLQSRRAQETTLSVASRVAHKEQGVSLDPWLSEVEAIADAICKAGERVGDGIRWGTREEDSVDIRYSPDLYSGAAGIALFLAAVAKHKGGGQYATVAQRAARWIASRSWGHGRGLPGLHAGEAGIGLFYIRLSRFLGVKGYVNAAVLRAKRLRGLNLQNLDIVHGAAGLLIFICELHDATGLPWLMDDALEVGNTILQSDSVEQCDELLWQVPASMPGASAEPHLGLLHGAAGIGLSLLYLARASGRWKYQEAAIAVGEMLLKQARPTGDVSSPALSWPTRYGDTSAEIAAHCHGAGGIGQYLLRLWLTTSDVRFLDASRAAAREVERSAKRNSSQCHGLAGDGALLLDLYYATEEREYLDRAIQLAHLLASYKAHGRSGIWRTNSEGMVSESYMTGYAGIGGFLLRLASPTQVEDLILPLSALSEVRVRAASAR